MVWNPNTFDPHDPDFLKDPYPTFALFREHAPVHPVPLYNSFWVFRYDDVKAVLEDEELFLKNSPTPSLPPPPFDVLANMPQGIFNLDPPRHTECRHILDRLLPDSMTDARQRAQEAATPLLVKAKRSGRSGRIELVADYALPLPTEVLMTVMGVPPLDRPGVMNWIMAILAGHDITQSIALQGLGGTCAMALGAYYQALAGCPVAPRTTPQAGRLLERMIANSKTKDEPRLSPEEVQATAVNFNIAGYLSTTFLIATGTYNLLKNPEQLKKLRDTRSLMPGAVAEMLRYDAPAQLVDRVAARPTELGGRQLRAGDKVTAVLGSANRDPGKFKKPDTFDITRDNTHQLAFGGGIHVCIGAPLVDQVAPVAFDTLLTELPGLELAGEPQWQTDPYLRSVSNLPLAWSAATS